MSFNRRGPDRDRSDRDRPDRDRSGRDRFDRPPQRRGDWQPRGDRPQGRPYDRRPRPDRAAGDEGGMSIRLDPRRLGTLKQMAAEAGTRPGELVRIWVEERIDAERRGDVAVGPGGGLALRIEELAARVAALEARDGGAPQPAAASVDDHEGAPVQAPEAESPEGSDPPPAPKRRQRSASAKPSTPRVGLHDEMIAVIAERGPMSAADLARAISERGRYMPPRSGKPLDAAMVSQRVSNPVYRSRFRRSDGRIGLAEES